MSRAILISAGEPSGEMHAARLAAALQSRATVTLFGLGGQRMREAGVELVADSAAVAVVGITEVVRRLPEVWRIFQRLADEAAARRPALAILVDFPDFNLRLARRLKRLGVRVVYFISPQVWAWRPQRVELMRRTVERVLCIFPFEEQFYRRAGVPVDYVGHPLAGEVAPRLSRAEFFARCHLDPAAPLVALLPGSRRGELAHNLPVMLEACARLRAERREKRAPQFVLALAPGLSPADVQAVARGGAPVGVVEDAAYDALAAADASLVASGTATVEAALLGAPMVVVYRVSAATAFIARRMVRTPHFAMVNLIAGRRVVPELIQEEFTAAAAAAELARLLDSPAERERMQRDLARVREALSGGASGQPAGRAIERAADIIAGML